MKTIVLILSLFSLTSFADEKLKPFLGEFTVLEKCQLGAKKDTKATINLKDIPSVDEAEMLVVEFEQAPSQNLYLGTGEHPLPGRPMGSKLIEKWFSRIDSKGLMSVSWYTDVKTKSGNFTIKMLNRSPKGNIELVVQANKLVKGVKQKSKVKKCTMRNVNADNP